MSTVKNVSPRDLHFELRVWLNELKFFKEELGSFEQRLSDEAVKHITEKNVMAEVEHFQNQFIRQKEVVDVTRHNVKQAENQLERLSKDHNDDENIHYDHTALREEMNTFRDLYNHLKKEFLAFLAQQM